MYCSYFEVNNNPNLQLQNYLRGFQLLPFMEKYVKSFSLKKPNQTKIVFSLQYP